MKAKLAIVILLTLSLTGNFILLNNFNRANKVLKTEEEFRQYQKQYPLVSLRLFRPMHPDLIFNFLELRAKLHQKLNPLGDDFALYFEYLPNGTSIGINSNSEFFAASLFKLPIVMAYYKHKEHGNYSEKNIVLTQEMLDDRFGDLWEKGAGYEISPDEAVRLALTRSDNTAVEALGPIIDQHDFDEVYEGLDIETQISSQGAVMTVKNYSSILKALYYSAVLSKENSNEILNYLTQSEFNDKLVAGVPADVVVAHKIGIINEESYRDCGIVYVPNRNYLLCMVSRGSEADAQKRMSEVSQMIYDYIATSKSIHVDK